MIDRVLRRFVVLVPLVGAGCAGESLSRPAVAPAATVIGVAERCIPLERLRETRIRDDWTIDFIAADRTWRNTLTSRCSGLKSNDAFSYETSLSELCTTDIVYVLETAGGLHRGPACGLGQFVPVTLHELTP